MYRNILVFAAHADDELTMAGTISAHAEAGAKITVVQYTNGSEGYLRREDRDSIVEIRKGEAAACDELLGISERIHLGYDDMSGTYDKKSLKECIKIIRDSTPEAVFTHGPSSLNRDHTALFRTTREAIWQSGEPVAGALGKPHKPRAVYFYKDYADRGPYVVFDATRWIPDVLRAYEAYASQIDIVWKKYAEKKAWNAFLRSKEASGRERVFEHFEAAYFHKMPDFIA